MVFGEIHLSICGPPGDGCRVTEFSQNHPKEMKKYFPKLLGFLHQFWKVRVRAFLLFTPKVKCKIKRKTLKGEQLDARWNGFIEQGLAVSLPVSLVGHWSRCIRIRGFIMMGWEWFRLWLPEARLIMECFLFITESDQQVDQSSLHFDKFHNVPRRIRCRWEERHLTVVQWGSYQKGRSVDEDGMVGWSSSCPLQSTSRENVCIGQGDQ